MFKMELGIGIGNDFLQGGIIIDFLEFTRIGIYKNGIDPMSDTNPSG